VSKRGSFEFVARMEARDATSMVPDETVQRTGVFFHNTQKGLWNLRGTK